MRTVWGFRSMGATRTLDSHACRLRQKLAVDGDRFVINVWGVGYRLVDPAPAADPLATRASGGRARFAVPEPGPGGVMLLAIVLAAVRADPVVGRERRRRLVCAELVARAAHELRGPLAAAHLGLQSLARERGRGAVALCGGRRAAAARRARRRRPGRGRTAGAAARTSRAPWTWAGCSRSRLRAWRPMAAAYGCELLLAPVAPGAHVRGDRLRLGQAVGNVVSNAVEHGRGRIELSARSLGDRVRIEVVDDGPGLPATVADLAARPRAGRGVRGRGLAIAADIARRHGGRLASAPSDRGARLALELPAVVARPGGEAAQR